MEHDDLEAFEDTPLVRALRAPGTADELAGEPTVLAAYRRAYSRRTRGRVIGRIGIGGAAMLAGLTLTSGVTAAAYTRTLPAPVQTLAHGAFGGIGVPPAPARTPEKTSPTDQRPESTTVPEASPPPRSRPRRSPGKPGPVEPSATDSASVDPSAHASETPDTTDGASNQPAGPSAVATSVVSTLAARSANVGSRVSVSGMVRDADGSVVSGQSVALLQRHSGGVWSEVSRALTDADGQIFFSTDALTENTWVRLALTPATATSTATAEPAVLRTRSKRIGVRPTVSVRVVDGRLQMHTVGTRRGDALTVLRSRDGRLVRLGIRQVDGAGDASLDLSRLSGRFRIVVRLPRTSTHLAGRVSMMVRIPTSPAPSPTPAPTPTPDPTPDPSPALSEQSGAPVDSPDSSTTNGS